MTVRTIVYSLCMGHVLALHYLAGQSLAAEPAFAMPRRQSGDLAHVEVVMEVGGQLKVPAAGQTRELPMSVVANLNYDEKLLAGSSLDSLIAARRYAKAHAAIKIDKGGEKPSVREDRRLVALKGDGERITMFSVQGPLTREELDLLEVPGNTVVIDQLLPEDQVAVGATWKHSDRLVAAILGIDAVSSTDVQSTLTSVENGVAKLSLAGSVSGGISGISTEIEVKAKYNYDLTAKRISYFALLVKEKRAPGHVSPGLDVVAKLVAKITPMKQCLELDDQLFETALGEMTAGQSKLAFVSTAKPFTFNYDRSWYVTSDEPSLTILRMVDRGELIAQCNVATLPNAAPDKQLTLDAFQKEIQQSLGKNFGQFTQASQSPDAARNRVYRVVATGVVSELPIQWIYVLMANEHGRQVSLAFTLESALTEKFGQADDDLIKTVRFADLATASEPTPAKIVK